MDVQKNSHIIDKIVSVGYHDPFAILGMHRDADSHHLEVRAFRPDARNISVVNKQTGGLTEMKRVHNQGFFVADFGQDAGCFQYMLHIESWDNGEYSIEDPYCFMPVIPDDDLLYFSQGNNDEIYRFLGSHIKEIDGVKGTAFGVWAPNAKSVSVVGDFNSWDGRVHTMRTRGGSGVWEIFLPHVQSGDSYKYEIRGQHGNLLPLKADPYAFYAEVAPSTASRVYDIDTYKWGDADFLHKRRDINDLRSPVSIYEVHLGSWRRKALEHCREFTYRELADELVEYVRDMGFTHVEFLPITEYPYGGSWGYQTLGMYAPTSRYGTPDDFKYMIDMFHQAGIGVIIDWVPAHFPKDEHGLAMFDGTCLYEHSDPRKGEHMDWGTKIYNYGRNEVANFLFASARFWIKEYHIDGLRVDAVASMIYLDYSREYGQWLPNHLGGNENFDATRFLKKMNESVYSLDVGAVTIAEESTAWPMVSRPTYMGGLGFGYKWNMGWMNDTLDYMEKDPIYRKFHQGTITFSMIYAFTENYILPLSHDEVVHGKGSILQKMPGDRWQKFANMRAYYTFLYGHVGKKMLFMGNEFAHDYEWNYSESLRWHLLENQEHAGVQELVRDLNRFYRESPALHEIDFDSEGFEWIDMQDADSSVLAFARKAKDWRDHLIVVCNFTPAVRYDYRIGVLCDAQYYEAFNSDNSKYGGSGVINKEINTEKVHWNNHENSVTITLPPLATVYLKPKR